MKKVAVNRDNKMNNTTTVALIDPGTKDIKRMELWTEWRPLLPVVRQNDLLFLVDPGPTMAQRVFAKQVVRLSRRK